ncbi:hypothetical protein VE03_10295 [Pseudogymnoascus sp. 23342-1-I1]|nr:hypothetical protein VE03_10295 [Pseudogymnoascus sp. 23342-1-I1]
MDIVRVTSDRQVLVESPQVGFAIWSAAFIGYSVHFPYMDKNSYMSNPRTAPGNTHSTSSNDAIALTTRTLKLMLPSFEHQRRVRELGLREGPNGDSLDTEPDQALDHVRSASRNGSEGGWNGSIVV